VLISVVAWMVVNGINIYLYPGVVLPLQMLKIRLDVSSGLLSISKRPSNVHIKFLKALAEAEFNTSQNKPRKAKEKAKAKAKLKPKSDR